VKSSHFTGQETMAEWLSKPASLRTPSDHAPTAPFGLTRLPDHGNRKPRKNPSRTTGLVHLQMATGSSKTYTAITSVYRLLKHADAKRILFLVDTTLGAGRQIHGLPAER
jgi:type I restriction enzyme R subunit